VYLSLNRNLVSGDEIVWPSSFLTYHHDNGRSSHNAVLCNDHHCDMVGGRMLGVIIELLELGINGTG
jgi:hypothetical protein